jgi:hypothetical protein
VPAVDLLWLPLGAGGHSVRVNGRVYELISALVQHRTRADIYHSALEITVGERRFVVEMAPAAAAPDDRGVVAHGPVGARSAGRLRLFRYEIRRWRGGSIPDAAEAVDSPRRLSSDEDVARRILEALPRVPTFVWGRDAAQSGDMWNSNSVVAWALEQGGLDATAVLPPPGGRAPGWSAGVAAARRCAAIRRRRPPERGC